MHGIPASDVTAFLQTPASKDATILRVPQLRMFGIFFNQNKQPIFLDQNVRHALTEAISKEQLVQNVFHGYATTLDAPMLPISPSNTSTTTGDSNELTETLDVTGVARARALLKSWMGAYSRRIILLSHTR